MSLDRNDVIAVYDRLLADHPHLTRKGKATAFTAINGNMFSFVGPDSEMCIRLSERDIEVYGQSHDARPVIRYNSVMKGYVAIPRELLEDKAGLADWFAKSVAFAQTLKPKATRKS